MKRLLIIIIGIMICSCLTSCYTTQSVLLSSQELKEQYIGKTEKEIIQMMGPPTRETTDGGDGSILIYESNAGSTTKVKTTKVTDDYYITRSNTTNQENYSWFYIDSKGVCTYVKTNSLTKQARVYNPGMTAALIVGLGVPALIFGAMAIFLR